MAGLRYLLDSNVLSEPSRPRPDAGVQSRLQSHRHEVCTAAPILHELHYRDATCREYGTSVGTGQLDCASGWTDLQEDSCRRE